MTRCRNCGTENPSDSRFCETCGLPLEADDNTVRVPPREGQPTGGFGPPAAPPGGYGGPPSQPGGYGPPPGQTGGFGPPPQPGGYGGPPSGGYGPPAGGPPAAPYTAPIPPQTPPPSPDDMRQRGPSRTILALGGAGILLCCVGVLLVGSVYAFTVGPLRPGGGGGANNTPIAITTPGGQSTPAPTVATPAPSPTQAPPTQAPVTPGQPTATPAPPTRAPTQAPPTQVPPTRAPPTQAPPTQVPPTQQPGPGNCTDSRVAAFVRGSDGRLQPAPTLPVGTKDLVIGGVFNPSGCVADGTTVTLRIMVGGQLAGTFDEPVTQGVVAYGLTLSNGVRAVRYDLQLLINGTVVATGAVQGV